MKEPAPTRLLIAVQYWDGDKKQAEELLRTIADLRTGHSQTAGVLIAARFDSLIDTAVVDYVARRFDVYARIATREGKGFPMGCNELWFDVMHWATNHAATGLLRDYKAILTLEPDCVILTADWVEKLSAAWDECRPAEIMGHIFQWDPDNPLTLHCNGNGVFGLGERMRKFIGTQNGCDPIRGWDAHLAPKLRKMGWHNTPLIRTIYRMPTLTETQFLKSREEGCVVLHGVKDFSGFELARRLT